MILTRAIFTVMPSAWRQSAQWARLFIVTESACMVSYLLSYLSLHYSHWGHTWTHFSIFNRHAFFFCCIQPIALTCILTAPPPSPYWNDHCCDQWPAAHVMEAMGGNTPNSAQPCPRQFMHPAGVLSNMESLFISLWSVSHPSAYGIMNWSFINKRRRTPGSSHVLLFSDELLQMRLLVCRVSCKFLFLLNYTFSANTQFLCKWGYLWSYCVGLERVIAYNPTRGEFYAHEECLTEWFRKKKKLSFTFQLFPNEAFVFRCNHTCLQSSTAHSTFLMDPCWIQPSYGWFNSHVRGCDNVTLGLWHTWINNTAAAASDES